MLRKNVKLEASKTTIYADTTDQLHITGSRTLIRSHPQEINLGKVDQTWFLDLLLMKGAEASGSPVSSCAETGRGACYSRLINENGNTNINGEGSSQRLGARAWG